MDVIEKRYFYIIQKKITKKNFKKNIRVHIDVELEIPYHLRYGAANNEGISKRILKHDLLMGLSCVWPDEEEP